MDASIYQFNAADPSAWRERMINDSTPEDVRVDAAAREFEAVLLRQYLDEAMKPLSKDGQSFGGGNPVYGYFVTEALAKGLSQDGVFGFSNIMQAQLMGERHENNDDNKNIH